MGELDRYFETNKEHWNAATPLHLGPGEVYDVEAFRKGASTLLPIERKLLGDVAGKTILHAQCHIGVNSMSLARLGAKVTGVDFSETAIAAARSLNDECGLDCRFICCNIYDLPAHLDEQYDIVYASYGVLCWLPDLPRWCQLLADRLRPGGTFIVIDGHPFSFCIKNDPSPPYPYIYRSYFPPKDPEFCPSDDRERDYHATDTPVGKPTYEWLQTLSDVVNAVAGAGLSIQSLGEYRCSLAVGPTIRKWRSRQTASFSSAARSRCTPCCCPSRRQRADSAAFRCHVPRGPIEPLTASAVLVSKRSPAALSIRRLPSALRMQ